MTMYSFVKIYSIIVLFSLFWAFNFSGYLFLMEYHTAGYARPAICVDGVGMFIYFIEVLKYC